MVVLSGVAVSYERGTPVSTRGEEGILFSLGKRELRNREPGKRERRKREPRTEEEGTDIGCEEGVASRLLDTSRLCLL